MSHIIVFSGRIMFDLLSEVHTQIKRIAVSWPQILKKIIIIRTHSMNLNVLHACTVEYSERICKDINSIPCHIFIQCLFCSFTIILLAGVSSFLCAPTTEKKHVTARRRDGSDSEREESVILHGATLSLSE